MAARNAAPATARLRCPKCRAAWTVAQVSDHCAFFPDNSVRVPGLSYTRGAGMTLRLGRRVWRVRERW